MYVYKYDDLAKGEEVWGEKIGDMLDGWNKDENYRPNHSKGPGYALGRAHQSYRMRSNDTELQSEPVYVCK